MTKPNGKTELTPEEKKAITMARVTELPRANAELAAPLDPTRDLWERQPRETDKAFHAFVTFRDMGPERQVTGAGAKIDKSEAVMRRWAHRWSWFERAKAWDNFLDAQRRAAVVDEVRAAAKRHIELAHALQHVGGQRLVQLAEMLKDEKARSEIKPRDARLMVEAGIRLERLVIGEPETNTPTVNVNVPGGDGERQVATAVIIMPANGREGR